LTYLFSNLPNGTYTITPSSRLYTYVPDSLSVTVSGADVMNKDFNSVFGSYSNQAKSSSDIQHGLLGIWFADDTHGWGIGLGISGNVIQNWNGTTWTTLDPAPALPSNAQLKAISGSSPNDVWIIGNAGLILHWNGSAWSAMTSPVGAEDFLTVWSRTSTDAWIGGKTSILHWNGTSWSAAPNNRSGGLGTAQAFWGASGTDVWTVTGSGFIAHWDGSIWNFVSSTSQQLLSLWGFAANDIWAVGLGGSIQHWNGSDWSPITSPTTTLLVSVWGSSPNDVWAVSDTGGVLLHWNGSTWTSGDSGTDHDLSAVFGSSSNNIWIAGNYALLKIR
jgi:hypothetical protein